MSEPSLVSRPPPFLPSICVHNNTREQKIGEKRRRPARIHHMNDVRWTWGGGAQLPKQDHLLKRSNAVFDSRP